MTKNYRRDIDGLRAIAVLAVVFYHAKFPAFEGGFVGVDIFFVISGYLITSIILNDLRANRFSFLRFYERRVRRIFPALTVMILLTVPFSWFLLTPVDFKDFSQSIGFALASISNVLFWMEAGYFGTESELKPLIHTWSLGIEEQFYLVFPFILMTIWRFSRRYLMVFLVFIIISSLVLSEFTSRTDQSMSFYLIHTRVWELMVGALLAYWGILKPVGTMRNLVVQQCTGLVLIFGAILLFSDQTNHPGFMTVIPVMGAGLLLRYGHNGGFIDSLLGNWVLVKIGLISYSLYLFHHPIFAFMRNYLLNPPTFYDYSFAILFSFLAAYGSYKYVETPFRHKHIVKDRLFWPLITLLVFILLGVSVSGHWSKGYPQRFGSQFFPIFESQRGIEPTVDGKRCHATFPSVRCIIGDSKAPITEWALVGDSHAGSLGFAIDEMLKGMGSSALQLTQGGCAYALGLEKKSNNCLEVNNLVRSEIFASDIKNIVIAGRYVRNLELYGFDNGEGGVENSKEDSFFEPTNYENESDRRSIVLDSYFNSINELVSSGKNVFLIYPIPEVGWDVPRYIFKRKIRNKDGRVSTDAFKYYERSSEVISMFDDIPDAENFYRIYPSNIFCDTELENRCLTDVGGRPLYFDDDHLTTFGAKMVTQKILDFQFDNKVD